MTDVRLQPSGAEAGTAPDDRRFRPDVQGLRAVAVLSVVMFHAGVPHVDGGVVGVDVFFVVSGFVITGVLLREHVATGSTSIVGFYARRVRRILPAATLCILVTVALAYVMLARSDANTTASQGRWAAVFLLNFHFVTSPLANFWSLSVEEQFYLVYPLLALGAGMVARQIPFRLRLSAVLVALLVGSYALSIALVSSQPTTTFLSPFTRAWELALGGLIAVMTPALRRVGSLAALATWVGLAMILYAVFFEGNTVHPGSLAALGAAAVIGGGTAVPALGAERLLSLQPFTFLGRISYSWYLWHWPILVLVVTRYGGLSLWERLALMTLALGVAAVSYAVVENPIRHAPISAARSVVMGAALIAMTAVVLSVAITLW